MRSAPGRTTSWAGHLDDPEATAEVIRDGWLRTGDLAVGRADDRRGQVPVAFVALGPGATADEKDLIDHVRTHLAHFKAPKAVTMLDELPRVGTGKIDKAGLRARLRGATPPG